MSDLCPLCGSPRTHFGYSHSDGEWSEQSFLSQQCTNSVCGLPCRLWERITKLRSFKERTHSILDDMGVEPRHDAECRIAARLDTLREENERLRSLLNSTANYLAICTLDPGYTYTSSTRVEIDKINAVLATPVSSTPSSR